MYLRKPWFLCKNTLAGAGLGLMTATGLFYWRNELPSLSAFQVGIVGFFLFIFAKHHKHHYGHHNNHHHKRHHY